MKSDLTWMKDCRIRCLVTFVDGSSAYSDEVHILFRDVMKNSKSLRRFAHIIEFGAVGLFAALSEVLLLEIVFRSRLLAAGSLGLCMSNSLSDLCHRLFVPGREFDVIDFGFDAIGYVLAIILVFGLWSWFHLTSLVRNWWSSASWMRYRSGCFEDFGLRGVTCLVLRRRLSCYSV